MQKLRMPEFRVGKKSKQFTAASGVGNLQQGASALGPTSR